uniref:DIS3-like exonuclease 1 n=1 Tax=Mucochytrium quahogii TaxID=96639 RepID=A0A7S2RTJ9_9STRA|mmetsp:Transcript_34048/g.54474  ORF Transcript_34048/g.54474 Transcript_34048/m.54474 type:complete len:1184 (-) Transcript_34048:1201-4752(-)|eukprot:CAMPEP_0203751274 /NCGR_PEP_ID=MMETSP0098-20131031/5372_1 /ASSEMBLY_ACC=CAM_ASM_000208 /TAXON_ID=96639 /ORGANISM=" , Strain NY0313808BC1" /LENGTH=1183 /DNA_ID=CAMNT_0050640925 /DNA_START=20 /DNA_END=3571 /DNA_ORIENTATION=+
MDVRHNTHTDDVLVCSRFSARSHANKKVGERYVIQIPCPFNANKYTSPKQDVIVIVPTATSFDSFIEVFNRITPTDNLQIVVLGSVLEKLQQDGKMQTFRRVREFAQTHLYFPNLFMGEKLDTVLKALTWLRNHLENYQTPLVTLSEHDEFLELARSGHFQASKTAQFFSCHDPDGLGKLALDIVPVSDHQDTVVAVSYWNEIRVQEALKSSQAVKGTLQVSSFQPRKLASVAGVTFSTDKCNRAIHGDVVVVSDGSVVSLVKRNWRPYVVTLSPSDRERAMNTNMNTSVNLVCIPLDPRIPKIRISSRIAKSFVGQRFVVCIDDWDVSSRYPSGHYVHTLGPIGDIATESLAILVETGLDKHLKEFTSEALKCLPAAGSNWVPEKGQTADRRDLISEGEFIFSVDPPGCQDIDDTMSFKELPGGRFQVGVHIADVTHFVKEGSALDQQAQERATSVYLEDRRLDMLPRLLCEDLCSLRAQVERYAVSTIWTLDANFDIEDVWMGRTLINSKHALSYGQAQRLIDGQDPSFETVVEGVHTGKPIAPELWDQLRSSLRGLQALARHRLKYRRELGALDLDGGGEFKFSLDATHKPQEVHEKAPLEVHSTVAELMIMANESVAKRIAETHKQSALLRRHVKPPEKKMKDVVDLARKLNIELDISSNAALAASMVLARQELSKPMFSLINDALTRSMSEAEYVCAGLVSEYHHFGLGLEFYTHFTSPIRRYADVIVHRMLLNESPETNSAPKPSGPVGETITPPTMWSKAVAGDRDLLFDGVDEVDLNNVLGADDDDDGATPGASLDLDDILGMDSDNQLDGLDLAMDDDFIGNMDTGGASVDALIGLGEPDLVGESVSVTAVKNTNRAFDDALCEHINTLHRAAKEASFRSEKLFFSLYFERNPQVVNAIVVGIREFGIICYVPKFKTKLVMRFDSTDTFPICTLNGNRVETLSPMVYNFNLAPHKENEYQSVNISGRGILLHLQVLDRIPVFIHTKSMHDDEQNQALRINPPQLMYYDPGDETETEVPPLTVETKTQTFEEFTFANSPTAIQRDIKSKQEQPQGADDNTLKNKPSLFKVIQEHNEKGWHKSKAVIKTKANIQRLQKGRMIFGELHKPSESQEWAYDDEDTLLEQPSSSFSSIQHDRQAVNKYVKQQTRQITQRMERLHAAKRDTKIKKRLKNGG